MKYEWIFFIVAMCVAACFAKPDADAYAKPDFDTYQPILDRMPFGAVPEISANLPPPTKDELKVKQEKEALARKVNMSAVTIMPDGRTAIGFTDISVKPPANHFLYVGDTSDGWTVLEADYTEETATIAKGDVEIVMQLGKGLIEPAAPAGGRPPGLVVANQAVAAANQGNMIPSAFPTPAFGGGPGGGSMPPGLQREARPMPSSSALTPPRPAGVPPAASRSYRDRLEQRVEAQQIEKEKAEQTQKETLKRLAVAAAEEVRKREQQEAAEATENDAMPDPVIEDE
jgi:hypothetical protein